MEPLLVNGKAHYKKGGYAIWYAEENGKQVISKPWARQEALHTTIHQMNVHMKHIIPGGITIMSQMNGMMLTLVCWFGKDHSDADHQEILELNFLH